MNDSRKLYRVFTLAMLGLTIAALSAHTAVLCFAFDREPGYHANGVLSTLLYILIALGLLCSVAYLVFAKKATKQQLIGFAPTPGSPSLTVYICSLLVAASFITALVWELCFGSLADTPSLLRLIGAVFAVIYFALPKKKNFRLFGLGAHLYLVFTLVSEYFDWTVPMNSPIKLMNQAATICVLLMMCDELLALGGKARPLRSTVCAALSAFFGLTCGLPMLVAVLGKGVIETTYLIHTVPPLALGIYASVRLLHPCEIEWIPTVKQSEQDSPSPENSDTINDDEEN